MLTKSRFALWILTLAALAATPVAGAPDPVRLEWKCAAGDQYRVVVDRKIHSTDTTVKEVDGEQDGEPEVTQNEFQNRMDLRLEVAEVRRGIYRGVFVKLLENYLDSTWTLSVSRTGRLLSATTTGDMFAGLPGETDLQREFVAWLKETFKPREFIENWTADAFAEVSEEAVGAGGSWESRRAFHCNDLVLAAPGRSTLLEIPPEEGRPLAIVRESRSADLDASELEEKLTKVLLEDAGEMAAEMEIEVESLGPASIATRVKVEHRASTTATWEKLPPR